MLNDLISPPSGEAGRLRVTARGRVQGVGFRPFVYRLAVDLRLRGWVSNTGSGVELEVEGPPERLEAFLDRFQGELPPHASIDSLATRRLKPAGFRDFVIKTSTAGARAPAFPPDLAVCTECLRELFDPADRRHHYPFINCTHCGPRLSIIEALPYDRANTTMRRFAMCKACAAEYHDPENRRFHAQPNACPDCGPSLEFCDAGGKCHSAREAALMDAAAAVTAGRILALKGLGGFQLIVDARNDDAVERLRLRKRREAKPFALMASSIAGAREVCAIEDAEMRLLVSPARPIVLMRRLEISKIAPSVAPDNPWLGVMLPCTPLHHLLMRELEFPVVATSGNLSDEPICIDNEEALGRLERIADCFLFHDRPIARPVDDSVIRVMDGRPMMLRRARGYAPSPIALSDSSAACLAVGGHLKNTVAVAVGGEAILSQHIGDLETARAGEVFREAIADLRRMYHLRPSRVVCDLHPDYPSAHYADSLGLPVLRVQHHYAHALACMTEHRIAPPVLAVAWDGTGYGTDGTIWGGEFLVIEQREWRRVAHLRSFRLPGGDQAVREGRRSALGVLHEIWGDAMDRAAPPGFLELFSARERSNLLAMLRRGFHTPWTSSAGRLFDAVAALTGLRTISRFEGEAAMALEYAAMEADRNSEEYPFDLQSPGNAPLILDWGPMIRAIVSESIQGVSIRRIAVRFHATLPTAIVAMARRAGFETVLLTGGCFQNRLLLESSAAALRRAGFSPRWPEAFPPGDGAIALGQLAAAGRESLEKEGLTHVSGHTG